MPGMGLSEAALVVSIGRQRVLGGCLDAIELTQWP